MRILLLGGTNEASQLAERLAQARVDAIFSYAGRTLHPRPQPLPTRIGGFGGAEGLAAFLKAESITHVVDATHPFAARISANAVAACAACHVPLISLERPAWRARPGEDWIHVADEDAAAAALPKKPARIFLAIGRQRLDAFSALTQHFYLLRMVDPPQAAPFPDCVVIGLDEEMSEEAELARLRAHRVTHLVVKNAGGIKARAKLDAARALGLRVVMIDRPFLPERPRATSVDAVMDWLGHGADRGV